MISLEYIFDVYKYKKRESRCDVYRYLLVSDKILEVLYFIVFIVFCVFWYFCSFLYSFYLEELVFM